MSSRNGMAQYRRTLDKARTDLAEGEKELSILTRRVEDSRLIVDSIESYLGISKPTPPPDTAQQLK